MGFTACNEDFEADYTPQENPQESILQASDITFTPATLSAINLRDLIGEDKPIVLGTVSVRDGAMPSDMHLSAIVNIAKESDFSDAIQLEAESLTSSNQICLLPSKLETAYLDNFTRDPNTTTLYMRTNLYTIAGDNSKACVANPSTYFGNYAVAFTPIDNVHIEIANAYYIVVKNPDGSLTETKCTHSEKNVYDDPVFTASINALKDDANVRLDTPFGIVAEDDLAAVKSGDTSLLMGKGEDGKLAKGTGFITGPATDGAAKYNITLDMESLYIVIEPEVHLYCYYLLGNNNMKCGEGDSYQNYMFYKVDDTTYSYTTFIPNNSTGKSWLNIKVWDRDVMKAGAEASAWGYSGTGLKERPESGSMKLSGGWLGPKEEGWYTMTIVMDEEKDVHTYQFTAIPEPTKTYNNISIIGDFNSWGGDVDLTECPKAPHNWYLIGYTLESDTELKFRANHEWNGDWGGDGSQPIGNVVYTLPAGTKNIKVPAGKYDFYLNDITGQWTILKVTE